jgi:hypothetical protein
MLSGPGALLFPKYLRQRSYVILSNVLVIEALFLPRFSNTNPFKSCHGYCLIPHVHSWS